MSAPNERTASGFRRAAVRASILVSLFGCSEQAYPPGENASLSAALGGSAVLDEIRSFHLLVFDERTQECNGPLVDRPGLTPVADSGLVRPDVPRVTLDIPPGPRTLYVEAYGDTDGARLIATGCTQVVLAPGERRTVHLELFPVGGPDADADADGDADANGDADADVDVPDVSPDIEDVLDTADADADVDVPDVEDLPESSDGDDGGGSPITLVISEIDYDQPGTDHDEFIELVNDGSEPVSCAGLQLVLVNGGVTPPAPYHTQPLACGEIPAGAFHLIAVASLHDASACPSKELLTYSASGGSIQNGPDVVALRAGGVGSPIVDQIAYAGTVDGWGEGSPSRADSASVGSLQRRPADRDTNDNAADFFLLDPPTPCAPPP